MPNGSRYVLYRKYRPKDFSEIVGQKHVVIPIQNALRTGRVAHAYLFSGPRGIGKTTVARLIAKSLNCLGKKEKPCNECELCEEFNENRSLNIIEIDAASNRGIDEIREIRNAVRLAPARGSYKTYIIDEAHMLTKEAFNALLKTLEEPPAHAVFILATTEIEKIPATIISRTQHYNFRTPSIQQIVQRLQHIAKKEGIQLDWNSAQLIAIAAEGSMRDAESILGQIMSICDTSISRESVEQILGLPASEFAKQMFASIAKQDTTAALEIVQNLTELGYDLSYFAKLLMRYFRAALFMKLDSNLSKFAQQELLPEEIDCLRKNLMYFNEEQLKKGVDIIFQNITIFRKSPIPQLPLELSIVEIITLLRQNNSSQNIISHSVANTSLKGR